MDKAQRLLLGEGDKDLSEHSILNFTLPAELEAGEPPEARGLARDAVRLLVSHRSDQRVAHHQFRQLAELLQPGDLLVINTSGTLNAALPATRADGAQLELHLSTHLPADLWVVELRVQTEKTTQPYYGGRAGEVLRLPDGAEVSLLAPYLDNRQENQENREAPRGPQRLWLATLNLPAPLLTYLEDYGFPIRYSYVKERWPLAYYQTVYATEPGSAEMPSAGRAFTPELITRLVAHGIVIAPLLLHTGVASLEEHEPPYAEFYRVPAHTARLVNATRAAGRRVVAVGTTVVRALETVTDEQAITHPGEGWTRVTVSPQRGIHAIDGLLTGWHEPRSTHLMMLEALAGLDHLNLAYAEALRAGYLWHEFGDLHLILP
ncbi:MAG: S-adenosylmethionine:tRNA ribosyltransferase-isomerase [Ktedonobacteraceae bacterium]